VDVNTIINFAFYFKVKKFPVSQQPSGSQYRPYCIVSRPSDKPHRVADGYALSISVLYEYNPDFTKKSGTGLYIQETEYWELREV